MQAPGFSISGRSLLLWSASFLFIQARLWGEAMLIPHCGHPEFSELDSFAQCWSLGMSLAFGLSKFFNVNHVTKFADLVSFR